MIERVAKTISRYNMFDRGQSVGVAVSGGADSLCLLYVLREIAPGLELCLKVLHLNHLIRGEQADEDESFVRAAAAELGLPVCVERVDVPALCRAYGDNLEQAARRARREFFARLITAEEVSRVATGHTRSDQAETVLFRVLRGCGTAGLSAIRPKTSDGLVRPLIEVTRPEVEEFLRGRGLRWRDDSTNAQLTYARNRIRHELLPALCRDWNPKLPETLARMAEVAQDEEEFWSAEVERFITGNAGALRAETGGVILDAPSLAALPKALARRLIRRAIELAKGDLRGISLAHVESVIALVETRAGHGRCHLPGLDVVRSFNQIRLAAPAAPIPDFAIPISAPGEYGPCGEGGARIRLDIKEASCFQVAASTASGYNGVYQTAQGHLLDWAQIAGDTLLLRNWKSGDQYRPVGHASQAKLKQLFQHARIPAWKRHTWPILERGRTIVWTARFGPAAEYAATAASRMVLRIMENNGNPGE